MARTKTHKLSGVKLNEVSLVGKGDNPSAHILLLKTKKEEISDFEKSYAGENKNALLKQWYDDNVATILKGMDCEAETFDELIQDRKLRDQIWDMIWTLQDSISSIINDDEVPDKEALTTTTVGQFQQAVSALFKGGSTEMKKTVEELEKALAEEVAKNAELTTKLADVEKAAKEPAADGKCKSCGSEMKKESTIDKSALPEEVRKYMEAQEAINKTNQEEITKLRDESITKECLEKAASIPAAGATEELSGLLKEVRKFDATLSDKVFGVLKTVNARIIEAGLFKEAGKHNDGVAKTAAEQLESLAKAYATENNVTYAKAYDHIYQTNLELRKAYNAER